MRAGEILGQKAAAGETFVQEASDCDEVDPARVNPNNISATIKSRQDYAVEFAAEKGLYEPDVSWLQAIHVDPKRLISVLRHLEVIAKRHAPRIAFKAKGKILFLELPAIVAVQAEGNYVSLRDRSNPYLLHESLSSMAEKLKPYGFIRIHRSVLVNTAAVEEIQALPTGEYRLRVKGGTDYTVTRRYKDNLRDLAELWVGSKGICD